MEADNADAMGPCVLLLHGGNLQGRGDWSKDHGKDIVCQKQTFYPGVRI